MQHLKKSDEAAKEVGGENKKDGGTQLRKSGEAREVEAVAMADGQAEHCGSEAGCNVNGAKEMGEAATEEGQAKRCCGGEDGQGQEAAPAAEGGQKCAAAGPGETGEEGGGFKLHGYEQELHGRWLMAKDRVRNIWTVMLDEEMPLVHELDAYLTEVG